MDRGKCILTDSPLVLTWLTGQEGGRARQRPFLPDSLQPRQQKKRERGNERIFPTKNC